MTHRVENCAACDVWIEKRGTEMFHYTVDVTGPYCDQCWLFMERIEELTKRVTKLEESV